MTEKVKNLIEAFERVGTPNTISKEDAKTCALIALNFMMDDLRESKEVCKNLHMHAEGLVAGSMVACSSMKTQIIES